MRSSNSEYMIPDVNEWSSVTELISSLRVSFQQKDYDKVQRLLILREERMQTDMNNLRRDYDKLREEHDSLAKSYRMSKLIRHTVEKELQRCKSDFKESKQELNKLRASNKVLSDRVSTTERRYKFVAEELKKVETEKEIEGNKLVDELAKQILELDKVRTERDNMIEKLISEKQEAKEKAELLCSRLQTLGTRTTVLEENVAKLLDVDVMHIRNDINCPEDVVVNGISPISSPANANSVNGSVSDGMDSSFKGESGGVEVENLQNGVNDPVEIENGGFGVELQTGSRELLGKTTLETLSSGTGDVHDSLCQSPHDAYGTENPDSPLEGNEHDNGETIEHGSDHPLVEIDGLRQEKVSPEAAIASTDTSAGDEMDVQNLAVDTQRTSEPIGSFVPVTNRASSPVIVEILDSEDESLASGSSDVAVICTKEVNPSGKNTPLWEKNGNDCLNDSCIDSTRKRKRSLFHKPGSCSNDGHLEGTQCQGKAAPDGVLVHDNDSSSEGEDNDNLLSYLDNMVAKFKRYNQNKWRCAADMFSAFEKDYELCMNAVCALYRKKLSAEKLNNASVPGDASFFHFQASSGMALAEYLIDGHPQNKLKKTLTEVQKEDPTVLSQCKDLALHYCDKLFDMYTEGRDRFFRPDL